MGRRVGDGRPGEQVDGFEDAAKPSTICCRSPSARRSAASTSLPASMTARVPGPYRHPPLEQVAMHLVGLLDHDRSDVPSASSSSGTSTSTSSRPAPRSGSNASSTLLARRPRQQGRRHDGEGSDPKSGDGDELARAPESTARSSAAWADVRVIGPTWSSVGESGKTPSTDTSPKVGLSPTMPQYEAGIRIEPPVSVPSAKSQTPAATSAAEPLLEPPEVRLRSCGLYVIP